jgi:hypothetical protein
MEFKEAGTQEVMTDWTLGDPRVRPRYTGWQAVKVLSPVEIESNHETGSFEINCVSTSGDATNSNQPRESAQPSYSEVLKVGPNGFTKAELGPPVVQPDAPRKGGSELATAYERMLPQITAPNLDRFNSNFSKLKSLNEELASRLDGASRSTKLDKQKLQDEFKTILKEKDRTKLDRDIAEFRDRYEQQFTEELNAAGIDLNTERQRAASLIGFDQQQGTPEAYLNASRMLAVGTVTEFVDDRPPVEAAPLFYEDAFAAPFTAAGSRAPGSANNRDGTLRSSVYATLLNFDIGARPQHNNVFVAQIMSTRRGARRLYVSVPINDLDVYMRADAVGGWASAEFAITLRVFDGERVVATRRVPVERFAATIVGFNTLNRRFPAMTLGCEFERSTADVENYSLVVEFETLANSFGNAHATSDASGRVGPFTVRTY